MAATDKKRGARSTMQVRSAATAAGFTLLEVMIAFFLIAIGLMGLFTLQAKAHRAELESYERVQALVLIQDMVDRMNANRTDAFAQAYVTASPVGGGGALTDCTGKTGAALDLCEWGNFLNGSVETSASSACDTTSGTGCVGAILAARGCISYDSATELADSTGAVQAGTGLYTLTIIWEGTTSTVVPSAQLTCGTAPYGARIVNSTLRIAALGAQ
jgi:type IV pilus assembly protein PilV